MKANKVPEKIYMSAIDLENMGDCIREPLDKYDIEYTRTDAFIEKACDFLKSYRQDTCNGTGYIAGIVNDKTIEDFRNYMEGE